MEGAIAYLTLRHVICSDSVFCQWNAFISRRRCQWHLSSSIADRVIVHMRRMSNMLGLRKRWAPTEPSFLALLGRGMVESLVFSAASRNIFNLGDIWFTRLSLDVLLSPPFLAPAISIRAFHCCQCQLVMLSTVFISLLLGQRNVTYSKLVCV